MPHTVNHILQDRAIRHAVFLERLKTSEQKEILRFLNRNVLPDIEDRIRSTLASTPKMQRPRGLKSTKRLAGMYATIQKIIKEGTTQAYKISRDSTAEVAKFESEFQLKLLKDTIPLDVSLSTPDSQVLRSSLISQPFQGETLKGWWSSVNSSAQAEIQRQLNIGLALGESINDIAARLFSADASAFSKMRNHATAITRTAVNHATTQAREETYKNNANVIKSVRYVATLDARTTDICASLDGREFKIGQGPRPPLHIRCRSTTVPITKSWKELGFNFKDTTDAQRASMDGAVPAKLTYRDWLSQQPKSVQNKVLGKGRAEIFRNDPRSPDKAFDRFVDDRFESVPLSKLKELEGMA